MAVIVAAVLPQSEISTYSGSDYRPHVAPLTGGDHFVAWGNDYFILDGRSYDALGAPGGEIGLGTASGLAPGSVATLYNGNIIATWGSGGTSSVYGTLFNPGTGAVVLGSFDFGNALYPRANPVAAGMGTSDFMVAWNSDSQDGSGYGVYAQRFDSNGLALSSEFRVNTFTSGDQTLTDIATVGVAGVTVVVWESYHLGGASPDIFARLYGSNGFSLSNDMLVNTTTQGGQSNATVSGLSDGSFVIAWESFG